MGCHFLLQEIFPTQGLNPCLLHYKQMLYCLSHQGFPGGKLVKNPPAMWETWVGKIPWRRERLPTPVFWPEEFHGPYSPWDCKESDTTERLALINPREVGIFWEREWKGSSYRQTEHPGSERQAKEMADLLGLEEEAGLRGALKCHAAA